MGSVKPDDPGHDVSARDLELAGVEAAMRRAAERARRRALENGSSIEIFRDGKIVLLKPDDEAWSR